jgi:hypothetical protein
MIGAVGYKGLIMLEKNTLSGQNPLRKSSAAGQFRFGKSGQLRFGLTCGNPTCFAGFQVDDELNLRRLLMPADLNFYNFEI